MAMNTLSTREDDEDRLCTIASFDRWAKLYDPFLSLFRLKRVRRETVDMSGVRPGDRVLDICTGTGDVALVTGVLGGLYPAWRATRMRPMEALRYECP